MFQRSHVRPSDITTPGYDTPILNTEFFACCISNQTHPCACERRTHPPPGRRTFSPNHPNHPRNRSTATPDPDVRSVAANEFSGKSLQRSHCTSASCLRPVAEQKPQHITRKFLHPAAGWKESIANALHSLRICHVRCSRCESESSVGTRDDLQVTVFVSCWSSVFTTCCAMLVPLCYDLHIRVF